MEIVVGISGLQECSMESGSWKLLRRRLHHPPDNHDSARKIIEIETSTPPERWRGWRPMFMPPMTSPRR